MWTKRRWQLNFLYASQCIPFCYRSVPWVIAAVLSTIPSTIIFLKFSPEVLRWNYLNLNDSRFMSTPGHHPFDHGVIRHTGDMGFFNASRTIAPTVCVKSHARALRLTSRNRFIGLSAERKPRDVYRTLKLLHCSFHCPKIALSRWPTESELQI